MSLRKTGSPVKIEIVKQGAFSINENAIAERFLQDLPSKILTIDQIHESLKQLGVDNYQADDLSNLINRLQSVGFSIK